MNDQVRVLVYHATADAAAIGEAYHRVSRRMTDVPGLLGNELLGSLTDPTGFVVLSRWADITAFRQWEQGAEHVGATAPLRPFRDRRLNPPFGVYRVAAAYRITVY